MGKIEKAFQCKKIFLFLGGPCSEMGAVCDMVAAKYSMLHVSMRDVLNAEVKTASEIGLMCKDKMEKKELIYTEVSGNLLKQGLLKLSNLTNGYVISGYPRNLEQFKFFQKNIAPCDAFIYIKLLDGTIKERLKKKLEQSLYCKRLKVNSSMKGRVMKATFPKQTHPDANEVMLVERVEVFHANSGPLLKYLKKKKFFFEIDAENTVDVIFSNLVGSMDTLEKKK